MNPYLFANIVPQPWWIDLFFIFIVAYFTLASQGFIHTIVETASFLISLIVSYNLYRVVGQAISSFLGVPPGIAQALGFFVSWFFIEFAVSLGGTAIAYKYFKRYFGHPINHALGYVLGLLRGILLFLFFISLTFALPVRGDLKQAILSSRTGPVFVNLSQSIDQQIKSIFNEAITESLNFMTIHPASDASYKLGFKAEKNLTEDPASEAVMLDLVNRERAKEGLSPLTLDPRLTGVARAYAREMFENGFFSHESEVDGSTPADRVSRSGIEYQVVGENLAFAPDVYIAHQGLMNSEGHRRNILQQDFGHVGIGIIDGGVYGRMFVQVFKD